MSKIGASTLRLGDLSGGINQLDGDTQIQDNEGRVCDGFNFEGNRLVTLKGYEKYSELIGDGYVKGIANIGEYLFIVYNTKVRAIHIPTNIVKDYTGLTLPANLYNVTIGRVFDYFIVLTDTTGATDMVLLRFVPNATFTSSTLTDITASILGLTSKKFIVAGFYNGKILLGGNPSNSALYFSKTATVTTENDIYDFSGLDGSSQYIGEGASSITGFKGGQDNFYIFKRDSVFQITSFQQNTHTNATGALILDSVAFITKRISNAGAINQQVIQQVEQDIMYFDGENVRRISYEAQNLAIKDQSISEKIYTLIQTFPKNQTTATALFVYPYYKLFLKSTSTGSNDTGFIYNVIKKSWGTQSNVSISTAASSYYDKYQGFIGNLNSGMVWKDNTIFSQDGFDLVGRYESKVFDCGDRVDYKRFTEVELQGRISPNLSIFVDIVIGGEIIDTREIVRTSNVQPTTGAVTSGVTLSGAGGNNEDDMIDWRERFEYYNDGRTYQFYLRFVGVGKFELHSHHFTYKYVKPYDIHY